ncbi:helix-turn-helix transcriptional regulator [Deinococcus sp. SDU3-2]|uniref:Helix-turn-helix transcriptional regulator n=1 Tax=Deinococcus terrestris TaxID=2651870 RepID=A0A7X1NYG5_9DEIO|nr:helix-turn-helix transcriptional regulator [Deinococcus terrestris]
MTTLNPTEQRLREQLEKARQQRGLTHAAIAEKLGIRPPSVTVILTRRSGKIPQSLIDVLDALGLELIAQPKERDA